jgi:hypothetical protein
LMHLVHGTDAPGPRVFTLKNNSFPHKILGSLHRSPRFLLNLDIALEFEFFIQSGPTILQSNP